MNAKFSNTYVTNESLTTKEHKLNPHWVKVIEEERFERTRKYFLQMLGTESGMQQARENHGGLAHLWALAERAQKIETGAAITVTGRQEKALDKYYGKPQKEKDPFQAEEPYENWTPHQYLLWEHEQFNHLCGK